MKIYFDPTTLGEVRSRKILFFRATIANPSIRLADTGTLCEVRKYSSSYAWDSK